MGYETSIGLGRAIVASRLSDTCLEQCCQVRAVRLEQREEHVLPLLDPDGTHAGDLGDLAMRGSDEASTD